MAFSGTKSVVSVLAGVAFDDCLLVPDQPVHISKVTPAARPTTGLQTPKKLPRALATAEVQAILDGCEHLRDRLLFAVVV
jgi:hypothetical protein